jgi:beta-lactamase class A
MYPNGGVEVSINELLRLAVCESDGVASDILLRTVGGPLVVDAYVRSLGISGISIRDTEKTIGMDVPAQYRNYAQPRAIVALLRLLADRSPLAPEHTELLLHWMTETHTGEHRLKALLPSNTVVAHKTGTFGQDNGITPQPMMLVSSPCQAAGSLRSALHAGHRSPIAQDRQEDPSSPTQIRRPSRS